MIMNSRDRILSAFKLERLDKIPVSIIILSNWFSRADEKIAMDLIEQSDPIISVLNSEYGMEYNIIFGNNFKEHSKILKNKREIKVIIHTPKGDLSQTIEHREESDWVTEPLFKTTDDINRFYSFPYESYSIKTICLKEYIYWKNVIKDQGLVVFEIYNAICMLYGLLGPEKFYTLLMDDFNLVKNFTSIAQERIEDYIKTIIQTSVIDKPEVFRMVGQEILGNPMADIRFYDELIIPYDSKLIKLVHDKGGLIYEHMHGKVRDVLEKKIKMGANAMGPFEAPPAGDITIKDVKNKLSGKVCVYGNVDDMQILANKDKRNIKLEIYKVIKNAAKGGGFILGGTESSIYNLETVKSFILMSKLVSIYGNYPINFKKIEDKISSLELC